MTRSEREESDMTSGQKQTQAARERSALVRRQAAARRHAESYVEALTLIGYTVIPPGENGGSAGS